MRCCGHIDGWGGGGGGGGGGSSVDGIGRASGVAHNIGQFNQTSR